MGRRHSSSLGCRAPSVMAFLLAGTMLSRVAFAQVDLELVVSASVAEAPVLLTVTAETPLEEPILAYRWSGLGVAPRCKAKDCTLDLPVAGCRRVAVTVTDRFGEETTQSRQICALEEGARPPQASIEVEGGEPMIATAGVRAGTATVTITRLWVDDALAEGETAEIPADGACHVIDLMAADAEGRIGVDQRVVCAGREASSIWVGAMPGFCVRPGETFTVCSEVDAAFGVEVSPVSGDAIPPGACAELPAPVGLERYVVRGDTEEARLHGSLLGCTAPDKGRPVLMFARIGDDYSARTGGTGRFPIFIDGGQPPFTVTGILRRESAAVSETVSSPDGDLELLIPIPATFDFTTLEVRVTDSRNQHASATASIDELEPPPAAADPQFASEGVASCTTARGEDLLLSLLLPFTLLLWSRRRR